MPRRTLPRIWMPLPEVGPNPAVAQADAAMWRWLDAHSLCRTDAARHNVQHTDNALCIGLYYPQAPAPVLALITEFTGWTLLVDEGFDAGAAGRDPTRCAALVEDFITVLNGGPPHSRTAYALAEVWGRIAAGRSADWCTVFRTDMTRWLWGFYAESVDRGSGRIPDLNTYLDHRRAMFGVPYYLHLCELAVGADLPDPMRRLPALTVLRNAAADTTALWNDICSVPREARLGYTHNAVLLAQREQHRSETAALQYVADLLDARTRRMMQAREQIPAQLDAVAAPRPDREAALRCADAYLAAVRGNFDYHRRAVRYTELAHTSTDNRTGFIEDLT
ncbi:terpene synthase family protein [Streptomyces sp. NPDC050617]|uniref:terpene synthase family protein n=1 Tax=Streptomyces sp. NPDC050617 TaxID=3154628 RepID=UPI00343327EF